LAADPKDFYRAANELIKQHGKDAKIAAAMQAGACADDGDMAGAAAWLRVIGAIEELQNSSPPGPSELRH
jgi:hypothetical protein